MDVTVSHNPKVAGSNPAPATIDDEGLADARAANPLALPRLHPGIGPVSSAAPRWPFLRVVLARSVVDRRAGDVAFVSGVDSQQLQFAVDSRRAPERIGLSHSYDERPDLAAYAGASRPGASGESGPVLAEAAPLPPQDSVGRNDDESLPPARPHSRQRDLEESVAPAHLRPGHRLLVDGKLVAQGQVLQGHVAVSAAEEGQQPKQVEQEGDHRPGFSLDQPHQINHLAPNEVLANDRAANVSNRIRPLQAPSP
jgi:hypothetical protein